MKHSKQKGNLGFSATLKELHKLGYNVFIELGDNSKTDLIVETDGKLIKFQVKYATENNGIIVIPSKKCGPNGYRYNYTENDIDMFSVYLPNHDKVIFVPSSLVCKNKTGLTIRYSKSKINQTRNVHLIEEFENLNVILKNRLDIL